MADRSDAGKGGWSMQFDMGGGITPRGRLTSEANKKKATLDTAKHDLKVRAGKSMMKLCDRDTQANGVAEMQKICDELKPELAPVVISVLCDFDGGKSAFARAQGARMFSVFTKYQPSAVHASVGKVVVSLCKRSRDTDTSVREACAETIGELARLACSIELSDKADETVELDCSTANDGPSLGSFFRPILQAMESADSLHQQGCALALAHVVFNAGPKIYPHLEKLSKRLLPILDNTQFAGRPQLLIAIANIVEICPEGFEPLLPYYMPRIQAACSSSEWNTRKAAMETVETMASRLQPAVLLEFKDEILQLLEKCKYDKMKPVREAASQALQAALNVEGFMPTSSVKQENSSSEEDLGDENIFLEKSLEIAPNNPQVAQSASPPQRAPMQQIKPSFANRMANKPQVSQESFAKPADSTVSLSSTWAPAGNVEQMPSKESWEQLLRHFERMTLQQQQLIEMVSGFSESCRERLETVEQKVYSVELRLAHMENRQSLPGLPPTPSRAHVTPSRPVPPLQLPAFPEVEHSP